ncbi:hypothetical protein KUF71_015002 [Frankliniella fusca]|uniref:Ubiquitin-like domain-containing protein n=1 Tax=Frankliniella fusca TaxID=407009 RepID=A0AAE1HSH5_9NEOP|nr:hypothetical protein KUF71_015002 [Frankliniella fusca]
MSYSDSSDDELLKPNGFVDVGADLVDVDFKETDVAPPPLSKKRKRNHRNSPEPSPEPSPEAETLNDVCVPSQIEEPDPVLILDDSTDVIDPPVSTRRVTRQGRRNMKSSHSAAGSRKSRRNASHTSDLDDSDVLCVEDSSKDIFEDSLINGSSFSFDQDVEDLEPEPERAEDPNAEVRVRVVWKNCSTQHFTLRKFQKIKEIFTHYAQLEGVEEGRILFTLRDKTVSPNDTPQSLSIGVSSLEGGVIDASDVASKVTQNGEDQQDEDPNALKLSIQRKGVKEKHTVFTYPHEKISVLMSKLSEELKIPYSTIKLMFDGDHLSPDSTPADYELEGDECIDLVVTK